MSERNTMLDDLGFKPEDRVAIFHADDVGMCHGANHAFAELSRLGTITCGAAMVPCPWFLEAVDMVGQNPDLDLGVHLTLTSEWKTYRWGPISTRSKSSGLIDDQGYFWHRVPMLAEHMVPEAAEVEMRSQIDRALSLGLDITHLDTHMGVAFLPQLFEIYLKLGREYHLPVLLPREISDYMSVLDLGNPPIELYEDAIKQMTKMGRPVVDYFRMTPGVPSEQSSMAYRDLIESLPKGMTFIALHPTYPGEIEKIVPLKAHYRTDEYRLFKDDQFQQYIKNQGIFSLGFRPLREWLRKQEAGLPENGKAAL